MREQSGECGELLTYCQYSLCRTAQRSGFVVAPPLINLFRINHASADNEAVLEWLSGEPDALFALARIWFQEIRSCGDDVTELVHDGCPVACIGDVAFAYVNVFTAHVNVGFFLGAHLPDPNGLLRGTGKRMRHVKIQPDRDIDAAALRELIGNAYQLTHRLILENPA